MLIPGYIDIPPDKTIFPHKLFLISSSHFMIELFGVSWIPLHSIPNKDGWNKASGHLNLSFPIVMTYPSGNSYDFSISDDEAAFCITSEKSSVI